MATVIDAVTALSRRRLARLTIDGGLMPHCCRDRHFGCEPIHRATASRFGRAPTARRTGLAWSGIKLASAPSPQSDAPALFASTSGARGTSDAASRNVWLSGMGSMVISTATPAQAIRLSISGSSSVSIPISTGTGLRTERRVQRLRVRMTDAAIAGDAKAYRIGAMGDSPKARSEWTASWATARSTTRPSPHRVGTVNRTAHGDYKGDQFAASLVGRYRVEQGSTASSVRRTPIRA